MPSQIEAIYDHGVFRPVRPVDLHEGQRVDLLVRPVAMSENAAADELKEWTKVFEGLSQSDVDEIGDAVNARNEFFPSHRSPD